MTQLQMQQTAERIAVDVVDYIDRNKLCLPEPRLIRVAVEEMVKIELKSFLYEGMGHGS